MANDDEFTRNLRLLTAINDLRDLPDTCDFCGTTVPADKIEPQSGDQWACHACLDRWQQEDGDAEVSRIMAMTDEEIRQDCIARGTTVEAEANKVRAVFQKALDKVKGESHDE